MRTDTIFYQLFQTFPSLIFELIGADPKPAKDYKFLSREIKELARRFDGIFLPRSNQTNLPIYFVEVQFQEKSDFYWRFFTEIFVYLGQYQPTQDWYALAIFASKKIAPEVPNQYRALLMSKQLKIVYLDRLTDSDSLGLNIVQLVVGQKETAKPLTAQAMQQANQLDDVALKAKVVELIETVLIYKFTELSKEEIQSMFSLSDLKETKVYQQGLLEGKQAGKQEGLLEGKQAGKQEGLLEGKQAGKLESVPSLLAVGLSVEQIAQALNLDVALVQQAADKSAENF
jgi:predicted transposase/invertase (TIGR01784 family)